MLPLDETGWKDELDEEAECCLRSAIEPLFRPFPGDPDRMWGGELGRSGVVRGEGTLTVPPLLNSESVELRRTL